MKSFPIISLFLACWLLIFQASATTRVAVFYYPSSALVEDLWLNEVQSTNLQEWQVVDSWSATNGAYITNNGPSLDIAYFFTFDPAQFPCCFFNVSASATPQMDCTGVFYVPVPAR